uniref:Uncharacterized protein n=1 Tax=Trichogramma kaykai TaxID=54128 RepID=A0ABD2VQY5_9HYME
MNFPAPIRVLLIMFGNKNDFSLRNLEQFWVEQLVDVTIIGISSRVSKHHHKIAIVNHETDYAATKDHFPIQ